MLQPRPTPWGASDGSLAADCLRIGGIASLAADWEMVLIRGNICGGTGGIASLAAFSNDKNDR